MQSHRTQRCRMYFLVRISSLFEAAKSSYGVKCIGKSARWADLTIRLVVEDNSMQSARMWLMVLHLVSSSQLTL